MSPALNCPFCGSNPNDLRQPSAYKEVPTVTLSANAPEPTETKGPYQVKARDTGGWVVSGPVFSEVFQVLDDAAIREAELNQAWFQGQRSRDQEVDELVKALEMIANDESNIENHIAYAMRLVAAKTLSRYRKKEGA